MSAKVTAPRIHALKGERPIVCVTAYDVLGGELADEAGVDVVLVGDSLGNVVLGYETTLPVTLEDVVHHTKAVRRGVKNALLVADLPFGSYQSCVEQAVDSAVALLRAGAEAVKLEGPYTDEVEALVKAGIPVMGHVGFTPQSVNLFGGFKVQGKGEAGKAVEAAAKALDAAGVFGIVLELMPSDLARTITSNISAPTIGIGAGVHCDGQIQVFHDLLGLGAQDLRHAKRYMEGRRLMAEAIREYSEDVRSRRFPGQENSF